MSGSGRATSGSRLSASGASCARRRLRSLYVGIRSRAGATRLQGVRVEAHLAVRRLPGKEARRRRRKIEIVEVEAGNEVPELEIGVPVVQAADLRAHD